MFAPNAFDGLPNGAVRTGGIEMEMGAIENLQKALTAGYGTDVSQLTGGSAFRIQSLDKTMQSTIVESKHLKLFNLLRKPGVGATVDEWTEQSGIGGFLGGSTNTETGNIASAQGQYARRVGMVKYLMTRREVSFVSTLGNNIVSSEAVEQQAGAKQLLSDAEFLCFEGDSNVVGTEFDGIYAQILAGIAAGQVDGGNVIDAEGSSLASVHAVAAAAAQVSRRDNFGTPTHLFMSQLTQADFDMNLDPAFRVPLNNVPDGGTKIGAPVVGIRTSQGDVATVSDVFIREDRELAPFDVLYPSIAAANVGMKPASVAGVAANDVQSKFGAGHAGNYYYFVAGVNAAGQSGVTASAQVAVAAGNKVTLTISASAGGTETGYAIYRSRLNGSNDVTDCRLMARIPKAGATTTFVDLNRKIPGTTKAFLLNMTAGDHAIDWRQLLPMLKFPLYPTVAAVIPWAQLMFGYLRITKRRHHAVIDNILPTKAVWRPFNV